MLIGHQRIWDFLINSVKQNKLAHAYLFVGPAQVGKLTTALEFTKWLFCEKKLEQKNCCGKCRSCLSVEHAKNPDVFIISAKKSFLKPSLAVVGRGAVSLKNAEIGIDEIRDLQHRLSFFPYQAPYKVAIIEEAASLSAEAASALLKTLEEPNPHSLIIMVSSSWQGVLPTIISRCQLIKFMPVAENEIILKLASQAKKEENLRQIIKLASGRPGRAINFLREPELLLEQEREIENFKKILQAPLAWRLEQALKMSQDTALAQGALSNWLLWIRDRILEASGQGERVISKCRKEDFLDKYKIIDLLSFCREIQKTREILNNSSFNARLALEVLMIKI